MRMSTERDRTWLKPHSIRGKAGARTLFPAGVPSTPLLLPGGCLGYPRGFCRIAFLQCPVVQLDHSGICSMKEAPRGSCLSDVERGKSCLSFCPFPFSPKIMVSGCEAGSGGITGVTEVGWLGPDPGKSNPVCLPPSSQVNLYIPKVSLSGAYDLRAILRDMGIADLLDNGADFSGMTREAQPKLSKVSVGQ